MRPDSRLEQTLHGSELPDAALAGLHTVEDDILEDVALLDSPSSIRGAVIASTGSSSNLVLSIVWEESPLTRRCLLSLKHCP